MVGFAISCVETSSSAIIMLVARRYVEAICTVLEEIKLPGDKGTISLPVKNWGHTF